MRPNPSKEVLRRPQPPPCVAPGPLVLSPELQVLNAFVKSCGSLDANLCCALLEEKLEDEEWKVCLRALAGIEALIITKKDGVFEYFDGNDDFIKEIASDPVSHRPISLQSRAALLCSDPRGWLASAGVAEGARAWGAEGPEGLRVPAGGPERRHGGHDGHVQRHDVDGRARGARRGHGLRRAGGASGLLSPAHA